MYCASLVIIKFNVIDASKRARSTTEVIRNLYNQYGVKGLFTGLVPRVIKVAPACAIMIATFEYGKILFTRLDQRYASNNINSLSTSQIDSNVTFVGNVKLKDSSSLVQKKDLL